MRYLHFGRFFLCIDMRLEWSDDFPSPTWPKLRMKPPYSEVRRLTSMCSSSSSPWAFCLIGQPLGAKASCKQGHLTRLFSTLGDVPKKERVHDPSGRGQQAPVSWLRFRKIVSGQWICGLLGGLYRLGPRTYREAHHILLHFVARQRRATVTMRRNKMEQSPSLMISNHWHSPLLVWAVGDQIMMIYHMIYS